MTKDIKSQSGFLNLFYFLLITNYYVILKSSIIMSPDDGKLKDIFDCDMSFFLNIFIDMSTLYSSCNYIHNDEVILNFLL